MFIFVVVVRGGISPSRRSAAISISTTAFDLPPHLRTRLAALVGLRQRQIGPAAPRHSEPGLEFLFDVGLVETGCGYAKSCASCAPRQGVAAVAVVKKTLLGLLDPRS